MTVGDVAKLAGISVRTLHHYDDLGILKPSRRSEAGYRLYTESDLARLQNILLYRELGFSLDNIGRMLADPRFDRRQALSNQRQLVHERLTRLKAMLHLIDKTLASVNGMYNMTQEEMFEVFGDFDPTKYEREVKERWGHSDAYKESTRRATAYSKEDWKAFTAEQDEINDTIAALMDEGVPATDPRAMDAVERHRQFIHRTFYPCSREMHKQLGEMYVADPRFTATYDNIRPGMARYVCDAISANYQRDTTQ